MGCNIVTAYTDEAVGHIGYPQAIVADLYERNYCAGNLLKQVPATHPYYIMGFNQSYAQTKLFTYALNKKEYFVFAAGRFLVTMDCLTKAQRSMIHEDKIVTMEVKGKLCLTGILGGRLILWDLQFFQQKINIKVFSQAINFSSISFSEKYIFCTDIEQPNNNIYCYDLRTAKFRAKSTINSYQPTFKGINWGVSHHVTAAADGLWFCQYIQKSSQIQITKGMFRIFPKTSMCCLSVVNDTYIISGSVDGYVFLWAHYQCQKVMKVGDSTIGEMVLSKNKLIVSSFSDNVRVFEYTIKQKKNIEEDQRKNGQITEDFVSVIIDSYDRDPLQSIAVSKLDQSIYYCQTRNGVLYNKMIPSNDYQHKMNSYKQMDQKIVQFEKNTQKYIFNDCIWLLKFRKQFFQLKKIQINGEPQNWRVKSIYVSNGKKYIGSQENILHCFIPQLNQVCYVGKNKVYLSDIVDISTNVQLKTDDIKKVTIFKFVAEGTQAISINSMFPFQIKQKLFIILYLDSSYLILKKQDDNWVKVENPLNQEQNKQITLQGQVLKFEQKGNSFRLMIPGINPTIKDKMSFMHCVHDIEDVSTLLNGKQVSVGGGFALIK